MLNTVEIKKLINDSFTRKFDRLECAIREAGSENTAPFEIVKMVDNHRENPTTLTSQPIGAFGSKRVASLFFEDTLSEELTADIEVIPAFNNDSILFGGAGTDVIGSLFKSKEKILITFSRPFTGQLKLKLQPSDGTGMLVGQFSKNTIIDTRVTFTNITGFSGGNEFFSMTDPALESVITLEFIDCKQFSFTLDSRNTMGITYPSRSFKLELVEYSSRFLRTFTSINGVTTTQDITFSGEPYDVLGFASEYDEAVIIESYSDASYYGYPNPNGGSVEDTISTGGTISVSTGSLAYYNNIRQFNVQLEDNVKVTIDVTLHGGATWQHILYGGSYNATIPLNQPPIDTVVVTATSATATNAAINYSSETRF
jgi:hypothetical protein